MGLNPLQTVGHHNNKLIMKKQIIYIVFITLFSFQLQAQEKKEAIKNLFEIMQIEKMTAQITESIVPAMQQQMQRAFKMKEDKAKFDDFMTYMIEQTKTLSLNLVTIEMPIIYEKHFSYEDIINLTEFYKTPTGQKLIDKTPVISKESMQIMMTKYMPEFQNKIQKKLKELKK